MYGDLQRLPSALAIEFLDWCRVLVRGRVLAYLSFAQSCLLLYYKLAALSWCSCRTECHPDKRFPGFWTSFVTIQAFQQSRDALVPRRLLQNSYVSVIRLGTPSSQKVGAHHIFGKVQNTGCNNLFVVLLTNTMEKFWTICTGFTKTSNHSV